MLKRTTDLGRVRSEAERITKRLLKPVEDNDTTIYSQTPATVVVVGSGESGDGSDEWSEIEIGPYHALDLVPGVSYHFEVVFSSYGTFEDEHFDQVLVADQDHVEIQPETHRKTSGRASFTLCIHPDDAEAGAYGDAFALELTASLLGRGWSGESGPFTGNWSYHAIGGEIDAGDITSGTLSTDRFSAYADLVAESKIGTGADQVAAGSHSHDSNYLSLNGGTLSGAVGIGAAPQALLDVYNGYIRAKNSPSNNSPSGGAGTNIVMWNGQGYILAYDHGVGGGYLPLRIDGSTLILNGSSTGNVGIGKSPSTALDVNGTVTATAFSGSLNASNISSGTVAVARLPVGTGSTQVAAGNHTHSTYAELTHASRHASGGADAVTPAAIGAAAASHTHTESQITDLDHNAGKIQGRTVSSAAPSTGQVLKWNGSTWAPDTDNASGDPATQPAAQCSSSSGASLDALMSWNTLDWSQGGSWSFSNAGLVNPTAGIYLAVARVAFTINGAATLRFIVEDSAGNVFVDHQQYFAAADGYFVTISGVAVIASGRYTRLWVKREPTSVSGAVDHTSTAFYMARLG